MTVTTENEKLTKQEFTTETGLKCAAFFDEEGFCVKTKLLSKVPKRWYYSCLNEMGLEAEEKFKFRP